MVHGIPMEEFSPSDQVTVTSILVCHKICYLKLREDRQASSVLRPVSPKTSIGTRSGYPDDFVFCHNDLSQSNIIVNAKTLKIAGIVDWELAGYFSSVFRDSSFAQLMGFHSVRMLLFWLFE